MIFSVQHQRFSIGGDAENPRIHESGRLSISLFSRRGDEPIETHLDHGGS